MDRMNTVAARRVTEGRHRFMAGFLDRCFGEWAGRS